MAVARINVELPYDIKAVWEVMTSLEHYAWRSDLKKALAERLV